jgi:hypothetical protein
MTSLHVNKTTRTCNTIVKHTKQITTYYAGPPPPASGTVQLMNSCHTTKA